MVKLALCLACAFLIGIATLQMRQQELELRHRAATLQQKIQSSQARLWRQQLEIGVYTAPNAMSKTIGQHQLELQPAARLPKGAGEWMDPSLRADATP
jgi:hypothetical protein